VINVSRGASICVTIFVVYIAGDVQAECGHVCRERWSPGAIWKNPPKEITGKCGDHIGYKKRYGLRGEYEDKIAKNTKRIVEDITINPDRREENVAIDLGLPVVA
jgi:hypothetical protein